MVRIKVIKGSHLLLALAALILAGVLAYIFWQSSAIPAEHTSTSSPPAEIIQQESLQEAKAQAAFASNASIPQLHIQVISDTPAPDPNATAHSILIYHTHTHEAYAQDSSSPYEALEAWRTDDVEHSVVRVGSALAEALRKLGYQVVHDVTDHEQDSLSDSYLRALETMEAYGESFDLRIDLHRDAYVDGLVPHVTDPEGVEIAQLMLLVGRGDAYAEEKRPPYGDNLALAQQLTSAMNARIPGVCRNVTVKQGRYNQHVDRRCILIEVGHNLNTLKQALASVPCLAASIDDVMQTLPDD